MNRIINILCATDDAYVPYCGIMLTSLFENNKARKFNIYIICESLSESSKKDLNSLGSKYGHEICYVIIDSELTKTFPIKESDHVSIATYYRLYAPVILPENIDKILYLDCDMIINGSIDSLYENEIENYAVAGVLDEDYLGDYKYLRLDIPNTKRYFNAGMLLINLKYWREKNAFERFMNCIASIPHKLLLHDQDTLNVVLKDEVKILPVKYNLQTGFLHKKRNLEQNIKDDVLESIEKAIVIHYTGARKPWLKHYHHPFVKHFRYYMRLSPWKDMKLNNSFKETRRYYRHAIKFFLHLKKYPYIVKNVPLPHLD